MGAWQYGQGNEHKRIVNLNHYYKDEEGWHSGPQLFISPSLIWVACDLRANGVHASCYNSESIGVEMVGDYGVESFTEGDGAKVRDNAVAALAILHKALGIDPDTLFALPSVAPASAMSYITPSNDELRTSPTRRQPDGAFLRLGFAKGLFQNRRQNGLDSSSDLEFFRLEHNMNKAPPMPRTHAQRDAQLRIKTLAALRALLAQAGKGAMVAPDCALRFTLGASKVDAFLDGGLSRARLHEVFAPWSADGPSAVGFGLGLALRAASGRPLFWVRQDILEGEAGRLNGMGLAEFGADPVALSLVRGKDAEGVLRAGVEAARCKSLGAALIEIFGAPRALDLTATLRLARAAEVSGVTVFLLRIRAGSEVKTGPPPSAAASRWRAQAQNSSALLANAPGAPCFSVTLLRHRGGAAERSWRLEWLRDRGLFEEAANGVSATLSGALAALPADGKAAPNFTRGRRAG